MDRVSLPIGGFMKNSRGYTQRYMNIYQHRWGMTEDCGGLEEDKPFNKCESNFLERVDNHIYFYSDIERDKILLLNKMIRGLSRDFMLMAKELGVKEQPNIYLHIFSYGGLMHAGLAAMDAITSSEIPINTIIDGACASAATLLTITGKKRYMGRNSFVLIHQIRTFFSGKHDELKDEMYNSDKFMKILKDVYGKYTKMPMDLLEQIISRDIWLDADECLKYGIVDEIIEK